ncbi:unnamed protein product [Rotaria sordida]|uniref:Uncharacterized protein n=1 Tax=Rotaria sordida TaxID=392033 RepID=A0A814T277_9BILA|nr:unnamed protein product [Rotaria sordida]CAF3663037.1 unnamed protein product [Rotaria sordida]
MVQTGSIHQFVQLIDEVNKEEAEEQKKKETIIRKHKKTLKSKHVSTQTTSTNSEPIMISDDYFDYTEELQSGFSYSIQSFYDFKG